MSERSRDVTGPSAEGRQPGGLANGRSLFRDDVHGASGRAAADARADARPVRWGNRGGRRLLVPRGCRRLGRGQPSVGAVGPRAGPSAVQRLRGPEHRRPARRRPVDLLRRFRRRARPRFRRGRCRRPSRRGASTAPGRTTGGSAGRSPARRADFERVGGYDEVYPCWGEEDNDLYDAFQFVGARTASAPGCAAPAPPARR